MIDNKVNFGKDSLNVPDNISIANIESLLIGRNYSSNLINDDGYKLVPNDGKHNIVIVDLDAPRKISWFYTAQDGREQAKEIINYFKDLFDKGEKK